MAQQITQEITALPAAPTEGSGFRTRAAAFLSALVTFAGQLVAWRVQVNAVAVAVNTDATTATTKATAASASQTAAAASATTATTAAATATTAATTATTKATVATDAADRAVEAAGNNIRGYAAEQAPANRNLGTCAYQSQTWLDYPVTWDAGSIANGAQVTLDVTVPGVTMGDFAMVSTNVSLSKLLLAASVTARSTVTLQLCNLTGAAVDLPAIQYYIRVNKLIPLV